VSDRSIKVGIALPNVIPGVAGDSLLAWARRAEERGFDFVSTIDRIAYPGYDTLGTLAAAAGATSRVGLVSNALLAPTYADVPLARATASVAALAGGRLTLALGIGTRRVDYEAVGQSFSTRGRAFDRQLEVLHRAWSGEAIGPGGPVGPPVPGGRVPMLIGGYGDHAVRRTVRWADGWTGAGGGFERSAPMVDAVRAAWTEAGRPGEPRILGLVYFSIGDPIASGAFIRSYYGYEPALAATVAKAAIREPATLARTPTDFEAHGFTELVFTPTLGSLDEVDGLADLLPLSDRGARP
jgi:alkanesulfonate monooxygenase SsuD/methylene tetrahydromethanopterin reductase-like flavin-dependent oxidoreductase (luciferase family)